MYECLTTIISLESIAYAMNMKIVCTAIIAAVLMSSALALVLADDSEATGSFTVTDGLGNEVTFDGPVDHIITTGKGATATVIQLGQLDKLSVCDNYSLSSEPLFDELKNRVANDTVKAEGNTYSSGLAQFKNDILDCADPDQGGSFDRTSDVVVVTASKTYADPLVQFLNKNGYQKVLVWYGVETYDDIVDFVRAISTVLGAGSNVADDMARASTSISETLAADGRAKVKAFSITYSGGTYKVGNSGSLATAMILAAGGDAYTINDSMQNPTYEATLTYIYEQGGEGTIVFLDSNIWGDEDKLNDVKRALPGVTLYNLESLWNNYSVSSADGVRYMASVMYPDLFSYADENAPATDNTGSSNLDLNSQEVILVIETVFIVLVSASFFLIRK